MRVSHETIYRSLFIQARGVLKKELMGHVRSKRRIRRSCTQKICELLRNSDDFIARGDSGEILRVVCGRY
jgi:IS30 family transposase